MHGADPTNRRRRAQSEKLSRYFIAIDATIAPAERAITVQNREMPPDLGGGRYVLSAGICVGGVLALNLSRRDRNRADLSSDK
jgi:hypothetical protein